MTFRRDARLDTSQVRDRRGMSAGKGVAAGGGLLGIVAVLLTLFLGGDPSQITAALNGQSVGARAAHQRPLPGVPDRGRRQRPRRLPHHRLREQRPGLLGPGGRGLPVGPDHLLHRGRQHRLRLCHQRRRPLLLPPRRQHLHRPRLLRRVAEPLRGGGRALRRGVRHRPRVRPPRPEPDGHPAERRPGGGRRGRGGAHRTAGRLLRRGLGQPRRRPPATWSRSPVRRWPRRSTPPPPWATTASRSRCRVG